MKTPIPDRGLLGENVRKWRLIRGFSQAELARRAGVGITTVYKAELGKAVRRESLRRIVEIGLEGLLEECMSTPRLTNVKTDDALYVKHNLAQTVWFVYGDRRRLVPETNQELIQDVRERIRLGRLGLAALFGCGTDYVMPNGPGILFYEVHGPTDRIDQNYRDAIYYALRGAVLIRFGDESVRLDEGESIGCDGTRAITMDLAEPVPAGELPPLVQFVGANRVGKMPRPRQKR